MSQFVPARVPTSVHPGPRPARRRGAVLGAALAVTLIAASCSKGEAHEPAAASTSTESALATIRPTTSTAAPTTTTAAPVIPTWPLTGVVADPAALNIPVLAVKVDNSPQARPHAGLNHADQVYELNVEGITRFMELYHSNTPARIGPVRSARSSDIDLFENLHKPLLAWSGGNPGVTAEVNAAQASGYLVDVGHVGPTGVDYYRDNPRGRDFEHTLYVDAPKLRVDFTPPDAAPPAPMFTFRKEGAPLPAEALDAPGMLIDFGLGVRVEYVWDAERHGWDRFQIDQMHGRGDSAFVDEEGVQVAPENVVILKLQYGPDPVDHRSPKAISVGEGEGIVLTQGKAVVVRWTRPEAGGPWNLVNAVTGAPMDLTPGRTWVALPDANQDQLFPIDAGGAAQLLTLRK